MVPPSGAGADARGRYHHPHRPELYLVAPIDRPTDQITTVGVHLRLKAE